MPPLLRQVHEDAGSRWRDPLNGWGEHAAGGVEVVPIAGDHLSLLSDAHLPALAETLCDILAKGEAVDGRA
jgi:thioesterase domain-containing protein